MNNKSNKALILLSGGLDSTVVLSICKKRTRNYMLFPLIMDKDTEENYFLQSGRQNFLNVKHIKF